MNFVETLLGLDPDGGSGVFEVAIAVLIVGGLAFALGRLARRVKRT